MYRGQRERYLEEIKKHIGIAGYFNNVIRPQLGSYYDDYESDLEVVDVVKCPLHTEDTPSFRIYRDSDSFYCFGCRRGGDVVSLHRYFVESLGGEKPRYDASLEYLYRKFCEGQEAGDSSASIESAVQSLGSIIPKDEPKSTPAEMVAYSLYVKNLEGMCLADKKMPQHLKNEIYLAIDLANNMVERNVFGASQVKCWLDWKRRELTQKFLTEHHVGCGC